MAFIDQIILVRFRSRFFFYGPWEVTKTKRGRKSAFWDAIIVTHSGFEKIPMSVETKHEFFREQLHELELAILEHKTGQNNRRIVKDLERAKKRLETKLKLLVADEKKDTTLTFEEIGVDRLFVDEAHYFKNLFYISKMTRIADRKSTRLNSS